MVRKKPSLKEKRVSDPLQFSINTNAYTWLESKAWSEETIDRYLRWRQKTTTNINIPSPFIKAKNNQNKAFEGRWAYQLSEKVFLFAEAHLAKRRFLSAFLFVGVENRGVETLTDLLPPLSWLISGLVAVTKADRIMLTPMFSVSDRELLNVNWGTIQTVFSPVGLDALMLPNLKLMPYPYINISSSDWRETDQGRETLKHLGYLERQAQRKESISLKS